MSHMNTIEIKSEIKICTLEELSKDEYQLVRSAINATDSSYSPYSRFKVGAALRLSNGDIVCGSNQENAAFGVTMCAERAAIFAAQSSQPEQPIAAIAIAARNADGLLRHPITPCGSCRQVMLEIEQRYKSPIKLYLYGIEGIYIADSAKSLMPLSFIDESMK